MKTIIVPLDESPLAEQILPYVQTLAPMLGAKVHLVRVVSEAEKADMTLYEVVVLGGVGDWIGSRKEQDERAWEILNTAASEYLAQQAETLRAAGLDVDFSIGDGIPSEIIVQTAANMPNAMITMATHGRSGVRGWALGSVTDRVVQSATTPVFVIRGNGHVLRSPPTFQRILIPLDGSEIAEQVLAPALELATHAQAEAVLLRVIAPMSMPHPSIAGLARGDVTTALRAHALQQLDELAGELRGDYNVPINTAALVGHVAETIVDYALDVRADLIAMTTHGRSGLRRLILGSVADKVLHAARTPLLIVHAK
jgi:nucleotide-binding universal stress UspA family protein